MISSIARVARQPATAWLWLAAIAIAVGATSTTVEAQQIGRPLQTCIARDTGQSAAAMMAAPAAAFDCVTRQVEFGPGDFWARTPVLPATLDVALTQVRYSNQWQRHVTLYAQYRDGRIVAQPLTTADIPAHLQLGAVIEQTLPRRAFPVERLMWRLRGASNFRRLMTNAELATPTDSVRENLAAGITYAAFAGLGVALLIYNLALWAGLRRRFQLAYCAMVASLVVYALASSGVIAWIWPALPHVVRINASYVLLAVNSAAALWFARTFFEPHLLPRWLTLAINALIAGLLVTGALFAVMAPWHMELFDKLHGLGYVAMIVVTVPLLRRARREGWWFLAIFAVGWAAPIMLAAMRIANTYSLVPFPIQMTNNILLMLAGQALLSSLAIAYRIHLLSRERDHAREQEIAARMLAATDPLTGLLNRRAFLEQAIGRAGPQRLLLADIDHFKRVNETIGHDGGDEVLRVFARALRAAVPTDALVARIGGEEFAIIAAEESMLAAATVLESLRDQRMPYDLSVTASIGTCTGPLTRETDWKTLYRLADRALFAAKAAGRDRARDAAGFAVAA